MFLLRVIIVTALCVLPTHGVRNERDEVGDDSEVGELLDLDEEERVERDDGEDGEDFVYEKIRVAYGHPPSRSCGGLGDPSGPQTLEL